MLHILVIDIVTFIDGLIIFYVYINRIYYIILAQIDQLQNLVSVSQVYFTFCHLCCYINPRQAYLKMHAGIKHISVKHACDTPVCPATVPILKNHGETKHMG